MKHRNKLFALILAVFMMAIVAPMAFAADDTVTIDLADGNIKITETGYTIDYGAETPFTGDYIITGKNDETKMANVIQINSLAEGSDITLKDVDITQKGPYCINATCDVAFKATGTIKIENTSVAVYSTGKLEITGDADITIKSGVHCLCGSAIYVNCKSLVATATSTAPVIYGYSYGSCKINAVDGLTINGWFSSGALELKAGGDIFVGNSLSTSPILQGETVLESTNGNITIDHNGMLTSGVCGFTARAAGDFIVNGKYTAYLFNTATDITATNIEIVNTDGGIASGTSFTAKATGDFTVNGKNTSFLFSVTATIDITAENVKVVNESGSIGSASNEFRVDATGDILLDGNSTGAPLLYATKINLKGDDITLTNNKPNAMIISSFGDDSAVNIDAAGSVFLLNDSQSPMISASTNSAVTTIYINAADIEIENKGTGMIFACIPVLTATEGDISVKANTNNPGISGYAITATAEKGDITLLNNGEGFVASSKITADAQNITLANPNATMPVSPVAYDLTAEEDITVITGYSSTTYNPNSDVGIYDFGNKLAVTTSNGTTEHTHEFADVAYNNDATCNADGTKLVKCDCQWPKEKTVTAEGTQLEHIDDDGDYLCDYGCGYEFEKPLNEACPDCGGPAHDDSLVQSIICLIIMLINLIKTMF